MRRLRAANPGKAVEVWAEDEARLGLKPITRRVWWLKGHRPRSCGRTKYEWLYVYGFARPATGETFTVILPRVKVERMAEALAAFAAHADPDGEKVLVLVVDNAGWHTAKRLAVPPNVRLHFLPAVHPGVAAGRAVLGAGPGGGGERHVRPAGRPPAGGPPPVPAAGRRPERPSRGPSGSTGPSTWKHNDSTQSGISWVGSQGKPATEWPRR